MKTEPHTAPAPPEVEQGTGYRLVRYPDAPPLLILAAWSGEAARMLAEAPALGVTIEAGFDAVDRLPPFAHRIRSIRVAEGFGGSLQPLNELTHLDALFLECAPKRIDLSRFPALRRCHLTGAGELAGLSAAGGLEELALDRPRLETLHELAPLRGLRTLELDSATRLASLDGIEGLPIERLHVLRARALRSVGAVASLPRVHALRLEGVRGVTDLERVGEAGSLRELAIEGGPALPGFGFLRGLRGLRTLSIDSTEIATGEDGAAVLGELTELRELHLASGLKHVKELEPLARLPHLEKVFIDGASELRSIAFLRSLPRLRVLWLQRTRIADRDLSPVLELPALEEVRIAPSHKQYTPSADEVVAAVRARNPELHQAREQRVQAARAVVNPHPAPAPGPGGETSAGIMADVPWRLDLPVSGMDELVARVRAERGLEGWDPERTVLRSCRVRLRVPSDHEAETLELASDQPEGFAAAELLYKLHEALSPFVRGAECRYFEGLVPTNSPTEDEIPLFEVRLGS